MSIRLTGVSRRFGAIVAVDQVDLEIARGELVALLGPSGSGKTTLLRIVAGLERADRGTVELGGVDVSEAPARERRVGFVFQNYALFAHMTIAGNVAFGLRVRPRRERPSDAAIAARVDELLARMELAGFADRYPHQLSGGQRQRVALARALAVDPRVLLLDEPFGALDARVRGELRTWLRRLHEGTGLTTVLVTHDRDEAIEVADRVAILRNGRIEQAGTPAAIYDDPVNAFVLDFMGDASRFPPRDDDARRASLFARPHEVAVLGAPAADAWPARLAHATLVGPVARLDFLLEDGGGRVRVDVPAGAVAALGLAPRDMAWLRPRRVHAFPA